MIKRILLTLVVAIFAFSGCSSKEVSTIGKSMPKNFRMVPMAQAEILQTGKNKMYCSKCGMTLPMFYKTNHAATVDGKQLQLCSMHCLVCVSKGAIVKEIKVVDSNSLKLIDAKTAYYVVGSSKPATMAKVSKYAFGSEKEAKAFSVKFGGEVMSFDKAFAQAKASFDMEKKNIQKKQAMMAKKGKAVYKKKCKPTSKSFSSVAQAKAYVTAYNICGGVKGKSLQMIGLYLESR